MSFRINTNIAALNAHTNALQNNRDLANALGKLSSGLRIQTAADDASGMTIADSLRNQSTGLLKAIDNGNDAIGIVKTADKAMDEQIKILDTIKAKAIQAAQDAQNLDSRKALQADIERLMEELDNIANTTSFNGQQLLNGTFSNKEFQIGAYSNETIKVSIGATNANKIGSTRFESVEFMKHVDHSERGMMYTGFPPGKVGISFLNPSDGTSRVDTERVVIGTKAGEGLGALAEAINKASNQTGVRASADVKFTSDEAIKGGTTSETFSINGIVIGKLEVKDNDANNTLTNAINAVKDRTGVEASIDKGKLTLEARDGRAISIENLGLKLSVKNETVGEAVDMYEKTEVGGNNNFVAIDSKKTLTLNGVDITFDGKAGATIDADKVAAEINKYTDKTGVKAEVIPDGGNKKLKLVNDTDGKRHLGIKIGGANPNALGADIVSTDAKKFSTKTVTQTAPNAFASAQDTKEVIINGHKIIFDDKNGGDLNKVIDEINKYTDKTGVKASLDSQNLKLVNDTDGKRHLGIKIEGDGKGILGDVINQSGKGASFNYIGKLNLTRLDGRDIDFKFEVEDGKGKVESRTFDDLKATGKISATLNEATLNLHDVRNKLSGEHARALGVDLDGVTGDLPAGVATFKGAQAVIDIAESAQKMLDRIRSDLGSVQNQLVVTINNISVTQVNVKAAESQIRDVDFASESANFSKFNILAQSGSYAMSQANAVQQNVLRLLQ